MEEKTGKTAFDYVTAKADVFWVELDDSLSRVADARLPIRAR